MPKLIDSEVRERAVRLVLERRAEYPSNAKAIGAVARQEGVGAESAARTISGLLFEHPVVNADLVRPRLGIANPTAYRAFDALVERGILSLGTSRKRNRVWVAVYVTDARTRTVPCRAR